MACARDAGWKINMTLPHCQSKPMGNRFRNERIQRVGLWASFSMMWRRSGKYWKRRLHRARRRDARGLAAIESNVNWKDW